MSSAFDQTGVVRRQCLVNSPQCSLPTAMRPPAWARDVATALLILTDLFPGAFCLVVSPLSLAVLALSPLSGFMSWGSAEKLHSVLAAHRSHSSVELVLGQMIQSFDLEGTLKSRLVQRQ